MTTHQNISARPGYKPRPKLVMPKPKRWSHQDDLQELVGKTIEVAGEAGPMECTLLAADQFTIKVEYADGSNPSKHIVIFKSALTYFRAL